MIKNLIGEVVSTKMEKTIAVKIERRYRHPKYGKVVIRHKKILAHNESLKLAVGDLVSVYETKPLAKRVSFTVVKKIEK